MLLGLLQHGELQELHHLTLVHSILLSMWHLCAAEPYQRHCIQQSLTMPCALLSVCAGADQVKQYAMLLVGSGFDLVVCASWSYTAKRRSSHHLPEGRELTAGRCWHHSQTHPDSWVDSPRPSPADLAAPHRSTAQSAWLNIRIEHTYRRPAPLCDTKAAMAYESSHHISALALPAPSVGLCALGDAED